MGRALPCLIRIVAACPRSRLIRVCASHNKTFPAHKPFILIQPGRRDPCSQDWPGYAASERPFWMPLAGASGRWPVPSGGDARSRAACPVGRDTRSLAATAARQQAPGSRLPAEAISPDPLSPRTLCLPGPFVSPDPSPPGPLRAGQANRGSPDRQTHRWPPDDSVRGPAVRSGRPAAGARASRDPSGSKRVQAGRGRPAQTTRCSGSRSPQCCP